MYSSIYFVLCSGAGMWETLVEEWLEEQDKQPKALNSDPTPIEQSCNATEPQTAQSTQLTSSQPESHTVEQKGPL